MVATITSPDSRSALYLSNYALANILDDLKRIPGVGDAQIFGALDYPCGSGSSPIAWRNWG